MSGTLLKSETALYRPLQPILIAIGANLPGPDDSSPLETCRRAVAALDCLAGLRVKGLSRWYQSAPIPPSGQPPYINGVAVLLGTVDDPAALLVALHGIEVLFGRVRGSANAARTLDLDLIGIGDLVRAAPDPILPHPRAHQRAFVLAPLRDAAPSWRHPLLGLTAGELLDRLPAQQIDAL